MGHLLYTALIGLVIGAVAKFIMPGTQGGGLIVTMLLGIVGSFVATFVGQAAGWYPPGASAGFVASVVGAIAVLWVYGKFFRKGS
ncbi:MAG: GlsB/YeaQ/YmgE family stress response membrane protein [Lautropia sp.]|nr:MAG: GlsB/YeaQ/YmgE family stress response membrane protein [Pseudomonadota bacterium]MBC6958371.1 GlsB/YeaQ/YmgE family stress response membrane protein [Lautropia sp.]MCL4701384.1 GlsB/YeaQ/YmgE family stress response membrane protein [Burkholderiaceae bacterium]MDL1909039.1 GlsB/YeaQ/YmgE family stress response membrane protein [Betaproteobacteria bacterium PRO1]RIK85825.1 MAG: GlsB/YeaQ/YmgE family stress response membrane protein [Burkholderiales bacterium]